MSFMSRVGPGSGGTPTGTSAPRQQKRSRRAREDYVPGGGTGWQTLMTDLSIVLFMIAASVVSQSDDAKPQPAAPPRPTPRATSTPSPQAEPLAVYRDEPGAPPLGAWLASQSADARQQLTIVAHYAPGGQELAMARAEAMAREAGQAGITARIVVEPGTGGTIASLAYDIPSATLARSLQ